ncbi:hypothetical protein BpHYR1_048768 [Brachionus plicatilis]|uniref:Uncharacterized protein n=1 Tax=Brachionus plicatilis TaxID=10195 RepID=A0A3M7QC32_BRAPC|nr:hypothetical protein BpHYR1_048768 [Brachionus plicatilis]
MEALPIINLLDFLPFTKTMHLNKQQLDQVENYCGFNYKLNHQLNFYECFVLKSFEP